MRFNKKYVWIDVSNHLDFLIRLTFFLFGKLEQFFRKKKFNWFNSTFSIANFLIKALNNKSLIFLKHLKVKAKIKNLRLGKKILDQEKKVENKIKY